MFILFLCGVNALFTSQHVMQTCCHLQMPVVAAIVPSVDQEAAGVPALADASHALHEAAAPPRDAAVAAGEPAASAAGEPAVVAASEPAIVAASEPAAVAAEAVHVPVQIDIAASAIEGVDGPVPATPASRTEADAAVDIGASPPSHAAADDSNDADIQGATPVALLPGEVRAGWLRKRGQRNKGWKRRCVVLCPDSSCVALV